MKKTLVLTTVLLFCACCVQAQDSMALLDRITTFPSKWLTKTQEKMDRMNNQITRQTERYLQKLKRRERRMQRLLAKVDSGKANQLFAGVQERYGYWEKNIQMVDNKAKPLSGEYLPYVDSLKGMLSFMQQGKQLSHLPARWQNMVNASSGSFNQLQSRFKGCEQVNEFIQLRKAQLQNTFSQYARLPGLNKYLNDYKKQAYYYGEQVKEFKSLLNDPDKLEKKALALLGKLPAYQEFMKRNSMLASLINLPVNTNPQQVVQGLASRSQLMSTIQGQTGIGAASPPNMVQQRLQSAEGLVTQWRDQLLKGNDGDMDMPHFKPNHQKMKSFFRRLEYGTNLQTEHGNYYFPTTTDFGLSIGYRITDQNTIGIGASYKMGWGKDINHIQISHQGVGLRSFIDIHISKSFFATGGAEYNYQRPFSSFSKLDSLDKWQKSGLLGISKIISMRTKLFKKTKMQLLWDFLSYQQVPRSQPFKFRVGYNF